MTDEQTIPQEEQDVNPGTSDADTTSPDVKGGTVSKGRGMAVKSIRFVAAQPNPLQSVTEVSAPLATLTTLGLVKQARHVDNTTGTVSQLVNVLVAAGLMAAK